MPKANQQASLRNKCSDNCSDWYCYLYTFSQLYLPRFIFNFSSVRLEQGTVTSLVEEKGTIKGVQYKTKTGEEMTAYAPLTIVCDGCFSNLRRSLCKPQVRMISQSYQVLAFTLYKPDHLLQFLGALTKISYLLIFKQVEVPSCFVGLVLENCELPYANHGHVILADPSPILFYPISSTEIRCLVDIPGQKVPSIANGEMAQYLKSMVAPQVHIHATSFFSFFWNI